MRSLLLFAATATTALRALPPLSPTSTRCTLRVHRVAPLRLAATTPPASADDADDELMRPGDASALVAGTAIGGGFLALPAMQTLVMHDFKDMSGLAGGLSKLVMTLISTGIAMFISFYFGDWGRDTASKHGHHHAQRLLWSLAFTLILCELWFWGVYCCVVKPTKRTLSGTATR